MGLFLPCTNKVGAFVGMATGLLTTGFLTFQAFILKVPYSTLPTSLDECPAGTNMTFAKNSTIITSTEFEWPTKLWTISYILYPFIGSMVTIVAGVIASYIGRCFIEKPAKSCHDYLHPLAKFLCCIEPSSDEPVKSNGVKPIPKNAYKPDSNGNSKGVDNVAFEMKNV
jgi:hypothetical protein